MLNKIYFHRRLSFWQQPINNNYKHDGELIFLNTAANGIKISEKKN